MFYFTTALADKQSTYLSWAKSWNMCLMTTLMTSSFFFFFKFMSVFIQCQCFLFQFHFNAKWKWNVSLQFESICSPLRRIIRLEAERSQQNWFCCHRAISAAVNRYTPPPPLPPPFFFSRALLKSTSTVVMRQGQTKRCSFTYPRQKIIQTFYSTFLIMLDICFVFMCEAGLVE